MSLGTIQSIIHMVFYKVFLSVLYYLAMMLQKKKMYGVGNTTKNSFKNRVGLNERTEIKSLKYNFRKMYNRMIKSLIIDRELYNDNNLAVEEYKKIKSYRGIRHEKGLPVRGQRTHTNANTRKRKKTNGQSKIPQFYTKGVVNYVYREKQYRKNLLKQSKLK